MTLDKDTAAALVELGVAIGTLKGENARLLSENALLRELLAGRGFSGPAGEGKP